VITRADIQADVVLGAEQGVEPLQARIRFLDAARVEEILLLADQDDIGGFHHGVSGLDGADQSAGFDHAERVCTHGGP